MKLFLFDLDRTLIHSDARVKPCYDKQGNLNVERYRRTQSPEGGIYGDTILPLAQIYARLAMRPHVRIYAITARECNHHDYNFLELHGLKFHAIFERGTVAKRVRQNLGDGIYKADIIRPLLNLKQFSAEKTWLFDDNNHVLRECSKLGIKTINALNINKRLGFNNYLF